jgi:hypothetical protein
MTERPRDREANTTLAPSPTVRAVLTGLAHDPISYIFRRWNWKSATLSAAVRGTIFFFANFGAGLAPAIRAVIVEVLFVATTNGFYGALTQSFATVRPFWAAAATVMVLVPAVAHTVEFIFHWAAGTPQLTRSIVASMAFSTISALFNLYAMRRGVLLVGRSSGPFSDDLRRLPAIVMEFLTLPMRVLGHAVRTWLQASVHKRKR